MNASRDSGQRTEYITMASSVVIRIHSFSSHSCTVMNALREHKSWLFRMPGCPVYYIIPETLPANDITGLCPRHGPRPGTSIVRMSLCGVVQPIGSSGARTFFAWCRSNGAKKPKKEKLEKGTWKDVSFFCSPEATTLSSSYSVLFFFFLFFFYFSALFRIDRKNLNIVPIEAVLLLMTTQPLLPHRRI